MLKHVTNDHKDEEESVSFKMKILGKFKDPLSRQIRESLEIKNREPASLLNSKSEFYGPCVKRKVYDS